MKVNDDKDDEWKTRSSANAEEPCKHTVSRNHVKCCMQLVNDLQGHSRSLPLLPFDSLIGHILFFISLSCISLSCTAYEILPHICQKIKMSHGQPGHKIWRFYLQPFHRNLTGCKILKWITWLGPCILEFHTPWNISGRAEASIVKFCRLYQVLAFRRPTTSDPSSEG